MSNSFGLRARQAQLLDRLYARLSKRGRKITAFVSHPEPRTIGSFARGRQLCAGNYLFAGYLIEAPETNLWDVRAPDAAFEAEVNGFAWLDDLAAVGDAKARAKAQDWLKMWLELYGRGSGPGWTPDLTGRRLIRWINHALFVMRGLDEQTSDRFFKSMAQQTHFLSWRWQSAEPGLPRFEALTGLVYAGLSLEGMEKLADPAIKSLARECERQINAQGGLPTRNPEDLLDVFTLLTWSAAALTDVGRIIPSAHLQAIERISPSLRTLRHSDGGLARFHGGGRGLEGWLDHALAASGIKTKQADGLSMGYARLSGGRTSVIIDASPPPSGTASFNAHASTLAFELTSGRRPVIVNCGSGASFGAEWRRAGRATPSHSTLCLDGYSSARLGKASRSPGREALLDIPTHVPTEISEVNDGLRFQAGHNGYVATHGLTHVRMLELTHDGRAMAGEDLLLALENEDKFQFDRAMDVVKLEGVGFDIRFHLHPEVDAALDMGGTAVSIALKSGEIWVFRHDGQFDMSLDPSVYLERGRLKPRGAQQIVLSGRIAGYAARVRWSLSKAQETAVGVRDLDRDDPVEQL